MHGTEMADSTRNEGMEDRAETGDRAVVKQIKEEKKHRHLTEQRWKAENRVDTDKRDVRECEDGMD